MYQPTQVRTKFQSRIEERTLHELLCVQARRSSWRLTEYCFSDENGKPFRLAPFHKEWHESWNAGGQHQDIGPRGHGKTENVMAFVLDRLGRNPEEHIKYISAQPDLATGVVAAVGDHIERNPKLHDVWPRLRPDKSRQWSRHALFVKRELFSKEPSLEAFGITTFRRTRTSSPETT